VGVGLGFHILFGKVEPGWVPRLIATAFLSLAILTVWLAQRRATALTRRLEPHVVVAAKAVNVRLVASLTVAATLALIATIWLVSFP
jgi:hypothetical protein